MKRLFFPLCQSCIFGAKERCALSLGIPVPNYPQDCFNRLPTLSQPHSTAPRSRSWAQWHWWQRPLRGRGLGTFDSAPLWSCSRLGNAVGIYTRRKLKFMILLTTLSISQRSQRTFLAYVVATFFPTCMLHSQLPCRPMFPSTPPGRGCKRKAILHCIGSTPLNVRCWMLSET